jgi:hypothetical protein
VQWRQRPPDFVGKKARAILVFRLSLKRESRAEIDLQEVVLGSIDEIPGGFREHPDMGSKAILEPAAKVTQHPVAETQAAIRS